MRFIALGRKPYFSMFSYLQLNFLKDFYFIRELDRIDYD